MLENNSLCHFGTGFRVECLQPDTEDGPIGKILYRRNGGEWTLLATFEGSFGHEDKLFICEQCSTRVTAKDTNSWQPFKRKITSKNRTNNEPYNPTRVATGYHPNST